MSVSYPALCAMASGPQYLQGSSQDLHHVTLENLRDGTVRAVFGSSSMSWTNVDEHTNRLQLSPLSQAEVDALQDLAILSLSVDTDVTFSTQANNSWSPSSMTLVYPDGRVETLRFPNGDGYTTTLTLTSDSQGIQCNGGSTTWCGQDFLPADGTDTGQALLSSLDLNPQGTGAWTEGGQWEQNQYSWSGTKYQVYAELAQCSIEGMLGPSFNNWLPQGDLCGFLF